MRIALLGWGSLVWDPRELRLSGPWRSDGPRLPIEFARESAGPRITMVIADVKSLVPVLWAVLRTQELQTAIRELGEREGVRSFHRSIGFWSPKDLSVGSRVSTIGEWARGHQLDAVVWTALQPGFVGARGTTPSPEQVVAFLRALAPRAREAAETYVRNAPIQIDTPYRQRIENAFGWSPSEMAFRRHDEAYGAS